MTIPGTTKIQLSLLTILAISSVSSTALQIYNLANNTSDANTSTNLESLEVSLGKLNLRVTGKNTMGVVMNLIPIESLLETTVSNVK